MTNWTKHILANNKRSAIPIMTHPGIEEIGKQVIDAVSNGTVHFDAIRALSGKWPADACTVIMDLTVEAEAFGANLKKTMDEVPSVTGRLVYDAQSILELKVPGLDQGRIREYIHATRLSVNLIKDKPIFSGCIGPFSLAARLFDMSEIMVALYFEPEAIHLLLNKCTDFIFSYCNELKKVGASGVIVAEPAAGLLSNEDCIQFSSVYIKKLVDKLQDDHFTLILHNCGNTGQCTQAMIESNAAALHFGNSISIIDVLKVCPENIIIMGNIDPVGIFKQGTVRQVFEKTWSLLNDTRQYSNFIISSGCDIPPLVPQENIQAFFSAIEKFNNQ